MFGGELDAGGMTDPNGMFSFFSSATVPAGMRYNKDGILVPKDGFGPGPYQGDYDGVGDRVYWGPSDGSPPIIPPPAVLNANTQPRNGVKLEGGVLVKAAKGGATPVVPTGDGSTGTTTNSSTGDTVLLPRSETSSVVVPNGSGTSGTGSGTSGTGSSSSGVRGPITNSLVSDSVAGPLSITSNTTGTSGTTTTTTTTTTSGTGTTTTGTTTTGTSTSSSSGTDSVHPSDWGNGLPDIPEIPDTHSVIDPSTYDGDSYHGTYDDGDGTGGEGKASQAPTEDSFRSGGLQGDYIEMTELRGPPSLHGHLDADGRGGHQITGLSEESPLLLGDMPPTPPNSVFDFADIDWRNVDPRVIDQMSEFITSDAGTEGTYLSSEGLGQNLGLFSRAGFANFLQSRFTDLGVGMVLQPIFNWIDDAADTPWVSRGIQGLMSIAGAMMGDPFGAIMMPFGLGLQELSKQANRKLENDNPDANYGKRYGFVREGHKWYPAYLTRSERDEGWLGSDRTQIRMSYGTDLKFKRQKGTGKMIPYFDEGTYRQKDYHVWDNELDLSNEQSGKAWRDQTDPLRDFYFMSEEDTTSFLKKLSGGDLLQKYSDDPNYQFSAEEQEQFKQSQKEAYDMMKVHDDVSWEDTWAEHGNEEQQAFYGQYGQYMRTLQDVRTGLEVWQDYLTSEPGNIYSTHADENQYSGAREFRRIVNDSGYLGSNDFVGPSWDKKVVMKGQMNRPKGTTAAEMQENSLDRDSSAGATDEGRWLLQEHEKALGALYGSQRRAGTSMHFDKMYSGLESGQPWRLYSDGTWEIGDTTTDEGLKDALRQIEAAGDSGLIGTNDYRSADQRDYLANKAYVRYLDNKLDQMGLSKESPYKIGDPYAEQNMLNTRLGTNDDFLPPQYSYADDFAKYGYQLPPTRDRYTYNMMKKYPEDQWAESWKDYDTQSKDFKLNDADLRQAQSVPSYLQELDVNPDMVAGRYARAQDFQDALSIISKREVTYYDPADEEKAYHFFEQPWDPAGDGVPLDYLPWDPVQRAYVKPADKTPGLVYDRDTGVYHQPGDVKDEHGNWVSPDAVESQIHKDSPATSKEPDKDADAQEHEKNQFWNFAGWGDDDDDATTKIIDDTVDGSVQDATSTVQDATSTVQDDDDDTVVQDDDDTDDVPVHTIDPVEKAPQKVPDQSAGAGQHVHETHDDTSGPPLPQYMQHQHRDLQFAHSSAPMHLPPAHTKVV